VQLSQPGILSLTVPFPNTYEMAMMKNGLKGSLY
jgi:hypothetical protein